MIKREFTYLSADGKTNIHAVKWLPEGEACGIVQIAHGVTEYILRYEKFAEYLTNKGFIVVGNDHLGHGTSIANGANPMYFGPKGSWFWVVKDIHTCYTMTKEENPNLPYCLLGFSLGSFLVRTYLIDYPNNVDASILIGTGQISPLSISLGLMSVNSEAKKVGEERTSPGIDKLTFDSYNKRFAPNKTKFDWLCSSEDSLNKYINDPLRQDSFTAGLFRELLNGMAYTGKKENVRKMNANIPILLLSGDKDPVGNDGKGVIKTYKTFLKCGIKDVSYKLYPNLRHDILNEDCKEDIYKDITDWLDSKLFNK